ncbi:MAG: radical SAM family heme chaperone HemW [Gammaproteobacteria bacterium]|nr:radical SAM family heme chaperone HemW [Gammaproteobacteria bacterium]
MPSRDPDPPPLTAYVHLPWCLRKCPYCDFNSHAVDAAIDQQAYVDALLQDCAYESARGERPPLHAVFIGGGTPSLFDAAAIGDILDGIDRTFGLAADAEITLEANPGAVDGARFAGYRAAGVNRLSIGVQSLDDACLRALGRIHSAADARAAYATARAAGFDSVNLDLMHGLPGQTVDGALADLRAVLDLAPEHLSWYQLTLEPNTLFHHRPPPGLPDDDALADILDAGQALLADAGFGQYEISAYAQPRHECRHNRNYWEFGDYLGIGAGAHGKWTVAPGQVERSSKLRQPVAYQAAAPHGAVSRRERVARTALPLEFMLNALRLNRGVDVQTFAARTGLDLAEIAAPLAIARDRGLMRRDPRRLAPTAIGQRFLNDLLGLFEPA